MALPQWIPLEIGGGPSKYEAAHAALRAAVGTLAGPEDGLEDAWRALKAATLVDAASLVELACMQALPAFSSVHIPVYEKLLKITPPANATEEDRRQRITQVWTSNIRVDIPSLNESLRRISTKLSVEIIPGIYATSTRFGRYYAPLAQPSLNKTKFPNFSTSFFVMVRYTLGFGETIVPTDIRDRVADHLNVSLPAWVDWYIHTGMGFFTDGGIDGASLLNSKLLGP